MDVTAGVGVELSRLGKLPNPLLSGVVGALPWFAPVGGCIGVTVGPLRGVDVGAKTEIYRLMNELAESGAAILMVSSELPEALGMTDRVLVMRDGRIAKELATHQTTQEEILRYATLGE